MTRTSAGLVAGFLLALLTAPGCVTRAELDAARLEDLRYMTRVIGYAIDANELSLQSRLTLLRAFEGDARYELLVKELGTLEENEERLRRVRAGKLDIVADGQMRMQGLIPPE